MFDKPVLLFSEYCNYSLQFLETLYQYENLYNNFIRINIDVNKQTRKRPNIFYQIQDVLQYKITEVPTVIVEQGQYVLSGTEAFKWLDYEINQMNSDGNTNSNPNTNENQDETLEAFNPVEMFSFSDSYAKLGSNDMNDASSQSFQFVGMDEQRIMTPQENSERKPNDNDYQRLEKEREALLRGDPKQSQQHGGTPPRMNMNNMNNMNNDSFNNANNMANISNSKLSSKKREVDLNYQELLQKRDSTVPKVKRNHVDFSTGTIKPY